MSQYLQLIIVSIIVTAAFTAAVFWVFKRFSPQGRKDSMCNGCTGCSIKNEFREQQKKCFDKAKTGKASNKSCKI